MVEALKIANTATFEELDVGYEHKTKWSFNDQMWYNFGEEKTEWIDISKPRLCSYVKRWDDDTNKYKLSYSGILHPPKLTHRE